MDAKVNEETPEAKTMRKHYADLTKAIQDPLGLAAELYSADVIAKKVLDSTIESSHTKVEKTMHLLQAVSGQIAINPEDFCCFLAVMRKDSSLQAAAELISSTYRHLYQGDSSNTEDDNLMYPKRLKLEEEHTSMRIKCNDIWLSWKRCCPIPETITSGTVVVIGSKVYVNQYFSHKIYEYETSKNTWSNEILCPRKEFCLAAPEEMITLVGGGKCILLSLVDNDSKAGTKQWSKLYKPMQKSRSRPATASNSSYFVVAGGDKPATVEVMELSTKEWYGPLTSLPKNDGFIGSATIIGDNLYLTFHHFSVRSCCPIVTCSLAKLVENDKSNTTQSIVRPLLWQKLPEGPPLYRPRTVQLCGNLLAIGGYVTEAYNYHEEKTVFMCKGSAYIYDEQKGEWTFVCQLPSKNGYPDHSFAVASLSEDKIIVMGGTQYRDDKNAAKPPYSDIVHEGTVCMH